MAVLVLIAGGIVVLAQSSFGHGLGAAAAIYEHGKPQVYRANYTEMSGQSPTMDVLLAVGVNPTEAQTIGCGVVRRELTQAGLPGVHWIVRAANGEPAADSATTSCP